MGAKWGRGGVGLDTYMPNSRKGGEIEQLNINLRGTDGHCVQYLEKETMSSAAKNAQPKFN